MSWDQDESWRTWFNTEHVQADPEHVVIKEDTPVLDDDEDLVSKTHSLLERKSKLEHRVQLALEIRDRVSQCKNLMEKREDENVSRKEAFEAEGRKLHNKRSEDKQLIRDKIRRQVDQPYHITSEQRISGFFLSSY